jgi:hypothetical protein
MSSFYVKSTLGLRFFFFTGALILGYYWYEWYGVLLVVLGGFDIKVREFN